MADLIQLLPDHIANQIAAGEVVQRPASVVKELLENAIDAGATDVQFVYRDAGKGLIQVVDDGCGMSPTDARMAFERHATSKIRTSDDLFAIQTMGFRGEALASIGAVSRVEVRTRTHNEPVGTRILIDDGRVVTQEPCQCPPGTNFMVQHLFYNVPARRKFLKSDGVETRHMHDEFTRVALAHPDVQFRAFHGASEVYHLPPAKLGQRIVGLLGKHYRERIVPVSEETSQLRIRGYVGKPEFAKKRGGDQFFFVNGRFIKSRYLHHAVKAAYDKLLPEDHWPMYVLFLTLDAREIDINVHPTKQEIKFEDERLVYQYLRVAVRHALGQFSVAPMMDFDAEAALVQAPIGAPGARAPHTVTTHIIPSGVGGGGGGATGGGGGGRTAPATAPGWRDLYAGARAAAPADRPAEAPYANGAGGGGGGDLVTIAPDWLAGADEPELGAGASVKPSYQLHNAYIVHQVKSGYLLIDQQGAHERVLYERYLAQLGQPERQASQAELFPATLELTGADAAALRDVLPDLERLGFEIEATGPSDGNRDRDGARAEAPGVAQAFRVVGLPADLPGERDPRALVTAVLDRHRDNLAVELDQRERIALTLARRGAVRRGVALPPEARAELVAQLLTTSHPEHTPSGQRCIVSRDLAAIERGFGRG